MARRATTAPAGIHTADTRLARLTAHMGNPSLPLCVPQAISTTQEVEAEKAFKAKNPKPFFRTGVQSRTLLAPVLTLVSETPVSILTVNCHFSPQIKKIKKDLFPETIS